MQTNHRINLLPLKRASSFAIQMIGLLFCFTAFGSDEIQRTYDYKGFDSNGVLRVSGVITLRLDDSTVQVKGDWKLKVLHKEKLHESGPQDGSGKISGYVKEDSIFLNLNPYHVQNNIYLDGRVTGGTNSEIKGKWGYYGFVGKLNEGNFEMIRKKNVSK